MLEPCALKGARTVLRGLGAGNGPRLLDLSLTAGKKGAGYDMSDHRVIGFFAYFGKGEVICDGDACIIAGSEAKMRDYISRMNLKGSPAIKKTRFGEIKKGLRLGAAYCFDEEAYSRFYPPAEKAGIKAGPQDFPGETPTGLHSVRVGRMRVPGN